ncbi:hypothetical protein Syun_021820 [Stephania yunnanensis]|uniref:Protein kinase domain-containing protein n=1 Tax=Stephania yunnanensis TaxID=152371 RepID=A0AAP0IHB3_9MAGN
MDFSITTITGLAIGGTFLLGTLVVSLIIFKSNMKFSIFMRDKGSFGESKVQKFMENYSSNLTTGYSYSNIKKMTKSFKHKIGEGGYGTVFKGILPNGRLVAVKMLEKSTENGQEFINEVATIGIIHHVNIIRLLGYCCEGSKRALVYEYMPNGSLGNLIQKENSRSLSHSLGWKKLLQIVKGIAYGIEYLHHGCDSRILHLDIKPHNILLDNDFGPKISDFGLAKLYSRADSVVQLTGGARGTIGYIAPEIFLSNLGGASHKSDVYSFGMLLLEILGLKSQNHQVTSVQNPTTSSTSSTSRSYFPGWVYEKLIQERDNPQQQLQQHDIVATEEDDGARISRKFIIVALWCIQMHPNKRPSMTRVVEMLSAENVEGIEIPPKPFFCSPPRNVDQNSYISSISNASGLPVVSDSE